MRVAETIKQRALEIGFDLAGVAPADVWKDLEFSRQWVEQGYAGEMHYLENPKRDDPRRILPSARSVVCVGLVYNADLPYSTDVSTGSSVGSRSPLSPLGPDPDSRQEDSRLTDSRLSDSRAWVSRYALGP